MLPTNRMQFGGGMDTRADQTNMPPDRVRDIANVDVAANGIGFVREGFTPTGLLPGARCLQGFDTFALCAQGDGLYRVDYPLATTLIATGLNPNSPVAYTQHAGAVWFTDGDMLGCVAADGRSTERVGLPTPASPNIRAAGIGGLTPGRYGLALSFVSATEESGISAITFTYTTAGVELLHIPPAPAGCDVRVYMTQPDGDRLYHALDIPAGLIPPILISTQAEGKVATNQYLTQTPGGRLLAGYNGRMYVARDNVLYFSEPLHYGLTSLQHGFVLYESEITLLQAVESGLYVGTREHLHYLAGDGPNAARTKLAAPAPVPWSGLSVPAGMLEKDFAQRGGLYAAWLAHDGYYLGTPDGSVIPLQSDRIGGLAGDATASVLAPARGINRVITTVE